MSGICSAHIHYQQGCVRCSALSVEDLEREIVDLRRQLEEEREKNENLRKNVADAVMELPAAGEVSWASVSWDTGDLLPQAVKATTAAYRQAMAVAANLIDEQLEKHRS